MKLVNANYYDGLSARQQAVTLHVANGLLEVRGEGVMRSITLANMHISEKLGSAPRLLQFADGGHCEIVNHADFDGLLSEAGIKSQSFVSMLENSWRHALLATMLTLAFVTAMFYWGLPWMADVAAARVPASVALSIDTQFLHAVDKGLMQPSQISEARQQVLTSKFDGLRVTGGFPAHRLIFRNSKTIGANAFALPGGTMVITDQLIDLAANDEEIFAVLAHELAHVSERHSLRQLLQSSVVGLAMTWYLGDISTLLAAAPTILLGSSYSRNFELRADRYAADVLRLNGIAPIRLSNMLEKLERTHVGAGNAEKKSLNIFTYFSSHPDTTERIRKLRDYENRLK